MTTLSWLQASDVVDQTPLIELLMASSSAAEADHVLLTGKPLNGGGPLNSIESIYSGFGLRVDRFGRRFEFAASLVFTASAASVDGVRFCLFTSLLCGTAGVAAGGFGTALNRLVSTVD